MEEHHIPVLLQETLDALDISPGKTFIDVTTGFGGHSKEILERLESGKMICVDRDLTALKNSEKFLTPFKKDGVELIFVHSNYCEIAAISEKHGKADGILGDLGVSSYQIDNSYRGFSYRFDGDLDMRMDNTNKTTAKDFFRLTEDEMGDVLKKYGEIRSSKKLANFLFLADNPRTTKELKDLLVEFSSGKESIKLFSLVFQAIRIWVNDELKSLEKFMDGLQVALKDDGRGVIMSYHSLEDRIVKNYVTDGEKRILDNGIKDYSFVPYFKKITKKPILASREELKYNPRSRSAKLRVFKKV